MLHVKCGFDLPSYFREVLAVIVSRLEILKSFPNVWKMFVHVSMYIFYCVNKIITRGTNAGLRTLNMFIKA